MALVLWPTIELAAVHAVFFFFNQRCKLKLFHFFFFALVPNWLSFFSPPSLPLYSGKFFGLLNYSQLTAEDKECMAMNTVILNAFNVMLLCVQISVASWVRCVSYDALVLV